MTLSTQDSYNSDGAAPLPVKVISDQLSAKIGPDRFELWFSPQTFKLDDQSVIVLAANSFSLLRLQNRFGADIRQVVDCVCGPQFKIEYEVAEKQTTELSESQAQSQQDNGDSAIPRSMPSTLRFPSSSESQTQPTIRRKFLNSFCYGEDNRLLKASVDQVFERPGQFSPLFVYGPTGGGKTHLLEAITNDFRRRLKMKRCVFLSAEQFTSQFVASLRGGSGLPLFRRKYRDLDLLAVDDIQFLAGKRATLGEFQHTIDNLIRNGKQVIVSSDRQPIELDHLGSDICNRLSAGLTCPVNYPDLEGRLKIAQAMCRERGLSLSRSVLNLICEQLKRDVRRISGAINRLHAYSISIEKPVSPELATKVLADLFALSGPSCTSLVSIEQAVCEVCGVNPSELKSPSRKKRISSARMLAMYLSRQYTGSAFSEIGDYFGGRSHSTVIAAEKKVAKWIEDETGIRLPHTQCTAKEVVRRIESNLRIS